MASNRQFGKDLNKGYSSEGTVERYLEKYYDKMFRIYNVTGLKQWRRACVDYLMISRKDGRILKLEVKSGVKPYRQVLLEMTENYRSGTKNGTIEEGWFHRTQADLMAFCKPILNDEIIMVRFKELKEWVLTAPMAKEYYTSTIIDRDECKTSDCLWLDLLEVKKDINPSWLLPIV